MQIPITIISIGIGFIGLADYYQSNHNARGPRLYAGGAWLYSGGAQLYTRGVRLNAR